MSHEHYSLAPTYCGCRENPSKTQEIGIIKIDK